MRVTGERWRLRNAHELNGFIEWVHTKWEAKEFPTVQILKADRSTDQNRMIYHLYGDIARQSGDKTVADVRCECKLTIGVPILRAADPEFCELYDRAIKPLPYQDKLMLMLHYDVTSQFTKHQATEYINTIIVTYSSQGMHLDDHRQAS